ncbi:MAG: ABC transporter ATP-binding protein [Tissierellia bacterium]|nr:ABC transporter ATP-binding protein [Tissierellia bacterium]
MEILKTIDLTKKFKDGELTKTALDNVNISIEEGEFVGILGPSGCGKSTLLNLIGGLQRPTSGEVHLNGTRIDNLDSSKLAIYRRRKVGIVYQFYNSISNLTAEQNILLPVLMDNRKVDKEFYEKIMKAIGLEDRKNSFPEKLSGGEQQRIAIARAIINKPAIVLLDEPTGNLDRNNRDNIMELLRYSNKAFKQAMLIVSHDEEIINQTDRMLSMVDGKIIKDVRLR